MSSFESAWERYRERTERALAARLRAPTEPPERLHEAIRYACLDGGKRFRAMLVYACGEVAGATPPQLDAPAAAVEMMHAYSLVHDDLPAMDDDDVRRGRRSCHIAYDEATAILVGDALQTRAFEVLASDPALTVPAGRRLEMIATLARATGADGMAGGQALDMQADDALTLAQLRRIHRLKTGALIRAAARLGGLAAAQVDEELLARLDSYAASIGLAFQIVDDVLDEGGFDGEVDVSGDSDSDSDSAVTDKSSARHGDSAIAIDPAAIDPVAPGKSSPQRDDSAGTTDKASAQHNATDEVSVRRDSATVTDKPSPQRDDSAIAPDKPSPHRDDSAPTPTPQKPSYISLLGREKAQAEARDLCQNALETAARLGDNGHFLEQLAQFVINRSF